MMLIFSSSCIWFFIFLNCALAEKPAEAEIPLYSPPASALTLAPTPDDVATSLAVLATSEV